MKRNLIIVLFVLIIIGITACENIFSTSLAVWAARSNYGDLSKLSYADASILLETALANNNRTLAQRLVPVFANFLSKTQKTDADYERKCKQLFDVLLLASNITTAYNILFTNFASGSELNVNTLSEQLQSLIVWNDSYSAAMLLCLDPEIFDVLDINAIALAGFALALDVGHDLNLNILEPTSITDPDDIQLLADSAQFQVVLAIIDLLVTVDPEKYPLVGAFSQLFGAISDLMT